jgi:hypothetical protein
VTTRPKAERCRDDHAEFRADPITRRLFCDYRGFEVKDEGKAHKWTCATCGNHFEVLDENDGGI